MKDEKKSELYSIAGSSKVAVSLSWSPRQPLMETLSGIIVRKMDVSQCKVKCHYSYRSMDAKVHSR
jgi:hypothetical protein